MPPPSVDYICPPLENPPASLGCHENAHVSAKVLAQDAPQPFISQGATSSSSFHAKLGGSTPSSFRNTLCVMPLKRLCVQSIIKPLVSGTINFNLWPPSLHKCSSQIRETRSRTDANPLSCTHTLLLLSCFFSPQISPVFPSHFQPLIFSITSFIKSNLVSYSRIVRAGAELQLFKRIGAWDLNQR